MDAHQYQVIILAIFVHNGSIFLLQAQERFLNTVLFIYIIDFRDTYYMLI